MPTTPLVNVVRTPLRLLPDARRVIAKPYAPSEDPTAKETRVARLLRELARLPPDQVTVLLNEILAAFAQRHRDFEGVLLRSYADVAGQLDDDVHPDRELRLLMGAYFTHEYAIEAAALFNPSMVAAPDQSGLADGQLRFVLSLRAVGEGHVSAIEFRTGLIDAAGQLSVDHDLRWASLGPRTFPVYDKEHFVTKLQELGMYNELAMRVVAPLGTAFSLQELDAQILTLGPQTLPASAAYTTKQVLHWLATSNYQIDFSPQLPLSERVLFPESPHESRGMEDARFVRFAEDDGDTSYYATYTAFDGVNILPQIIKTKNFASFRINTLNGRAAQNKGMALFPRKIDGHYMALGRFDREHIDVMRSDDIYFWERRERLLAPTQPWELFQMGNCGSPIETEAGWLVLTHGVGAMRRYTIGALLLDRERPERVLAELPEPLLVPQGDEREGYVPNVVYSCGGLVHQGRLVLPYGFSDAGAGVAVFDLEELLGALRRHPVVAS